jgi:hypothetical protein
MTRRRNATAAELAELVAEDDIDPAAVRVVVDRLAQLGVPVDSLVRITVDEPMTKPPTPDFLQPPEVPGEG